MIVGHQQQISETGTHFLFGLTYFRSEMVTGIVIYALS